MITQEKFIKTLLGLGLILFSFNTIAQFDCKKEFKVLERVGKKGYKLTEQVLDNLDCDSETFEGKYFKIVFDRTDQAIKFNSDLKLKAANVYWHLTKARSYWVNELGSSFVKSLPQIVVRLEIDSKFSRLNHFMNDQNGEIINNAWTIPSGKTPNFVENKKSWNTEVWFGPMKKLKSRELDSVKNLKPLSRQVQDLKNPIIDYSQKITMHDFFKEIKYPEYQDKTFTQLALRHLGVWAITEGITEASSHFDFLFIDKYYYVDTAMIPDIIYHEYAHVALSDMLPPKHSTAVIESLADYFATRVHYRKKMYAPIKGHSNNAPKELYSKKLYHPYHELQANSHSDFTLSLLWTLQQDFNNANLTRPIADFDQLLYRSREFLSIDSDIQNDLTQSLVKACKNLCANSRIGISILLNGFEKKGL